MRQKVVWLWIGIVAALVLFGWWYFLVRIVPEELVFDDRRSNQEVSVVLTDQGFMPPNIRIQAGSRVTFSTTRPHEFWPASNPHPTHTIYREFDPEVPIAASSTWSYVFTKKGVWGYHDHIRSYFTGVISVE